MPSTLFRNAVIWSGSPPKPESGWLLVTGETISAIGTDTPPQAQTVIDLAGRHLLPGFVDAHSHLTVSAWLPLTFDGSLLRSHAELLTALRRRASERLSDAWLLVTATDFDLWQDGLPSMAELDEACNGRPTLISDVSLHRCLVSSAGLAAIRDYTRHNPEDVERRHGVATGLLWESANAAALKTALSDLAMQLGEQGQLELLRAEAQRHLALGVTTCHDPCIPTSLQGLMEQLRTLTPLKLSWSRVSEQSLLEPAEVTELCPNCGDAPPSAKLFMDGAHRCAMCLNPSHVLKLAGAALGQALKGNTSPLRDLLSYRTTYRQGKVYMPYLRMETTTLTTRLETLGREGVRPKIHALGNYAVRCACEAIKRSHTSDATIEHLTVLGSWDMDAVADSGAVASLQPGFLPHFGPAMLDRAISPSLQCIPIASLANRGVSVCISSDNPCGPLDPLHNLRLAVTRRLDDGRLVNGEEAVSIETAVAAYTSGGLKALGKRIPAALTPGAAADLVVLTAHPLREEARVIQTWVNGSLCFQGSPE